MSLGQDKIDLIHKGILETVQVFTKICDENNLKYFMTGGTLIGAIRHQGFIPWDDDMDIFMPREDYEKFLKISKEVLPNYIEAKHYSTIKETFVYMVIKLENKNYKIIRKLYGKNMNFNLFIDIFPLDGFPEKKIEIFLHKIKLKYRLQMVRLSRLQMIDNEEGYKKYKRKVEKIVCFLDRKIHFSKHLNIKKEQYMFEKVLKKYKYSKSNKVFFALGPYGMFKEIYPKSLFERTKMYKFENIELRGVVDYDRHLRQVYGDYMQLPPEDQRVCLHVENVKYVGKGE